MFVADSNVVISCLHGRGTVHKAFLINSLLDRYEFIAPEFLWVEVDKHMEELIAETKYSPDEFKEILEFLEEEIDIVPAEEFLKFLPKAKEMLQGHTKDALYLALSLKYDTQIFSGDTILKNLCPDRVITPRELLDKLSAKEP